MITIRHGELSNMLPACFQAFSEGNAKASQRITGKMCGKFSAGFNLLFQGERDGEQGKFTQDIFIYVGTAEKPLCCFGISISEEEMNMILESCEDGCLAVLKGGNILIYGRGEQFLLETSRTGNVKEEKNRPEAAEEFTVRGLEIPDFTGQLALTEVISGFSAVWEVLEEEISSPDWKEQMGLLWDERFLKYSEELTERKPENLPEAISFFTGRGKGLTPGGDDVLLGYGAVLKAFSEKFRTDEFFELMKRTEEKTTEVSRAYYRALEYGYVNEDFRELLFVMAKRDKGALRPDFTDGQPAPQMQQLKDRAKRAVLKVERLGHTSGRDTLYGAFLAMKRLTRTD